MGPWGNRGMAKRGGPRCRVVGGPGAPDARGAHVARGAPGSTGARCAPAQAARAAQPAHPARFAHLAHLAHSRGPSTDQIARAAQPIRRICALRYLPDLVLIQSRSDRSSKSLNCLSGRPRAGAPAPWRGRQPWPWRPRSRLPRSGVVKRGGEQEGGFAGNGKMHFYCFARRGRPTGSDYWPGGAVAATRPDEGGDQRRGNTVNRIPRGPHQAQILAARKPTAGSRARRKPERGNVLTAPRGVLTGERGILTVPGVAKTPARALSSLPSELPVLTAAERS